MEILTSVDSATDIRILSLCSGYAGLELGLRRVVPHVRTVCYVEIELFAVANLVAKMEAGWLDAAPVWTDIKTFPAERFRGKVHGILAGYPCQPFSVAGKRDGESDPRHLWPDIERIVRAVEPVWCFFENVPGHLSLGFPAVYRSLRDLGYAVEAGLFTAAECGAPMCGTRFFILGKTARNDRRLLLRERGQKQAGIDADRAVEITWPPGPRDVSNIPRAVDGPACRVDRLRLLGNGVVPAQAAKAFEALWQQMMKNGGTQSMLAF